ncbi:hypothetical protein EDC32_1011377 [Laceyella sacchari]|nr:hypothetical protein EDC32_1011377 [Laceyella sacchari]
MNRPCITLTLYKQKLFHLPLRGERAFSYVKEGDTFIYLSLYAQGVQVGGRRKMGTVSLWAIKIVPLGTQGEGRRETGYVADRMMQGNGNQCWGAT